MTWLARVLAVVVMMTFAWQATPVFARQAGTLCVRGPARRWLAGQTVMLADLSNPPCVLSFAATGVTLRTDGERVLTVGRKVALDARGRYYTYSGRGEITVWNGDGSFRETIGRNGAGPGEFANGSLSILPAPSHQLYVFDNNRRWTVLDSTYRLLHSQGWNGSMSPSRSTVLDDGAVLDADRPDDKNAWFSVATVSSSDQTRKSGATATNVRVFGKITGPERQHTTNARTRLIAYAGGAVFWAGPPMATGRGYVLEEWSTNGVLRKRIQRTPAWYPPGIDAARPSQRGEGLPPGEIESVGLVGSDLLWIVIRTTNAARWRAARASPRDTALRNGAFDIYSEVVDMRSGRLLASEGPIAIGVAARRLPTSWSNRFAKGFLMAEGTDGETNITEVVAYVRAR